MGAQLEQLKTDVGCLSAFNLIFYLVRLGLGQFSLDESS